MSNNVVEVISYSLDKSLCGGRKSSGNTSPEDKIDNRRKTLRRNRTKVRRLVECNPELNRFLTLTFEDNVDNLDYAFDEFRKFIQRLRYNEAENLKYIATIEFQKRGAIHFHLLVDRFIDYRKYQKIWGHGYIWIERPSSVAKAINYITKYITKLDACDKRLWGRKSIFTSRNLVRPIVREFDSLFELMNYLEPLIVRMSATLETLSSLEFDVDFVGRCQYRMMKLFPT